VELKFTARPRLARSVRAISDDLITGRDKGDFIAKDRADRARVIKCKRAAGANYTCNNLPGDLRRARARARHDESDARQSRLIMFSWRNVKSTVFHRD